MYIADEMMCAACVVFVCEKQCSVFGVLPISGSQAVEGFGGNLGEGVFTLFHLSEQALFTGATVG